MAIRKPMLAKDAVLEKLEYPLWVQPKIDGIRFMVDDGIAYSRSLKPLPNKAFQTFISDRAEFFQGMDGEVVVGDATDPLVFNKTMSGIMSQGGNPDFNLILFDMWESKLPYISRYQMLTDKFQSKGRNMSIRTIETPFEINNQEELLDVYKILQERGYEGAILRKIYGVYKHGRSTVNEGLLLKMKPWKDAEATIIGFNELMRNENEPTTSPTGYQVRSSHKDGKVGANTLGAFVLKNDKLWPGQTFTCGSGLDDAMRAEIWAIHKANDYAIIGHQITFKYLDVGIVDKPRHPIFKGFRNAIDT